MKYFYALSLLICLSSCSTMKNDVSTQEKQKTEEQNHAQLYNSNCKSSHNLASKNSKNHQEKLGKLQNEVINCHGVVD